MNIATYSHALRSSFFDITDIAETPDDIARNARYVEDGLLFIGEGKTLGRRTGRTCAAG